VVCKRHENSYFLSSAEIAFLSLMQQQYRVPMRYSNTEEYGSRFVTMTITGNTEGEIDLFGYQVSIVGEQLIKEGIVEPSVEPGLMRVCQNGYQPELFYKWRNEYGIEVKTKADPTFPVEYLLVTLTHGFPAVEKKGEQLPRQRSLSTFGTHVQRLTMSTLGIRFLVWAQELVSPEEWKEWRRCYEEQNEDLLRNLKAIHQVHASVGSEWQCQYCTFINSGGTECQMCSLPK
jgi:nuclear protein localization family protein 4